MDDFKRDTFLSGMISGCFQTLIGHPLDTLKVYKQTNIKSKEFFNKKLFNGMSIPLVTNSLVTGLQFYSFQNFPMYMGLVSAIVVTPIEYYKTQKQVFGIYPKKIPTGFPVTFMRENIALNCYFNSFNILESKVGTFIAGGLAGSLSWLLSYPFDTIKSRVQSNMSYSEALKKKHFFNGISLALGRGFIVNGCGFYSAKVINRFIYSDRFELE